MKTRFTSTEKARAEQKWYVIDATDQVVGRVASKIAAILRGKNKPSYTPHTDDGDFVVVVNAAKVRFTGQKLAKKEYKRHTGYIGGVKTDNAGDLLATKPEKVIERAVQGMLASGPLARKQLSKLKVYRGAEHPHKAQQPSELKL